MMMIMMMISKHYLIMKRTTTCFMHGIVTYRPVARQDLEKNETTAAALLHRGKHAFTTIGLLLETVLRNPLLDRCNSWTAKLETDFFYVVRAGELL
jgi:hypothetical protein